MYRGTAYHVGHLSSVLSKRVDVKQSTRTARFFYPFSSVLCVPDLGAAERISGGDPKFIRDGDVVFFWLGNPPGRKGELTPGEPRAGVVLDIYMVSPKSTAGGFLRIEMPTPSCNRVKSPKDPRYMMQVVFLECDAGNNYHLPTKVQCARRSDGTYPNLPQFGM